MLASSALRRLAASAVPRSRSLLARTPATLTPARAATAAHLLARRAYATNASDTEATDTVKKAVKAKAKAAPKKKATTKAAPKKAAPKKAKKAAPKKAAPKKAKKPKKELTVDEKKHAKWSTLREKALLKQPIPSRPVSSYNVFVAEKLKGSTAAASEITHLSKDFANLTPAEREHWNHLAAEENTKRAAEYRAWVESYTPEDIRKANLARASMRSLLKANPDMKIKKPRFLSSIQDDRTPLRPNTPWIEFISERSHSEDFRGIELVDRTRLVASEWKALSEDEKKPYVERAALNAERFRAASAEAEANN